MGFSTQREIGKDELLLKISRRNYLSHKNLKKISLVSSIYFKVKQSIKVKSFYYNKGQLTLVISAATQNESFFLMMKNSGYFFSPTKISVSVVLCWFVSSLDRNGYEYLSYIIACTAYYLMHVAYGKCVQLLVEFHQPKKDLFLFAWSVYSHFKNMLLCCFLVRKSKCWHITDSITLVFRKYMYCFPVNKKINNNHTSWAFNLNILFRMYFYSSTLSLS